MVNDRLDALAARFDTLERVSGERWARQWQDNKAQRDGIEGLYKIIWRATAAIIVSLAVCAWALFLRELPARAEAAPSNYITEP